MADQKIFRIAIKKNAKNRVTTSSQFLLSK